MDKKLKGGRKSRITGFISGVGKKLDNFLKEKAEKRGCCNKRKQEGKSCSR
ncbi:MAG: hypothetical protein GF375_05880 [Candidatus Omnitrophica bacterium]|nr:hypothetical protein [Candidatus Omnitrophota bacterium]MBD3269504.1 hypothetical protein [Candidatus Omnitrophota bacterium]